MEMRTICDVCENTAAIVFCAADEAALCRACDDKVSVVLLQNSSLHPMRDDFSIVMSER